jgi:hypothetical protein
VHCDATQVKIKVTDSASRQSVWAVSKISILTD